MNIILSLLKNYISTSGFLALSILLYFFSDSSEYAKMIIESLLPENGRVLAFVTFLGLIFVHEVSLRYKNLVQEGNKEIKSHVKTLQNVVEKGQLISDVNSAFTEFKASGRESITGEYYIKEIMTLSDSRKRLNVNSYTQNKLNYLIGKIKHD